MIVPYVGQTRLEIHPHEGLTGHWYVGLPEFDEMSFLLRVLRPSDCFFDVGANAGAYSILATSLGCRVIALEPVPATFERLRANVELNRAWDRVVALNSAATSRSGSLRITTRLGTGNHVVGERDDTPCAEVTAITLDAAASTYECPTFLKIDVEGHELEVIHGARKILKNPSLAGLLIETFRGANWQRTELRELEAVLARNQFLPFGYNADTNLLSELLEPYDGGDNTLYLRHPDAIRHRLRESSAGNRIDPPISEGRLKKRK